MIKIDIANIEIDAEGKGDHFIFHVKIPCAIHRKYADRFADEFEKAVTAFARIIEKPEFWEECHDV